MRGDERALPPRDQGPVRRFVRDFVDSRRTAAEFFFWIALVVLAGSFVPVAAVRGYVTLFWLAALLLIVVDSTVLSFRLHSELARRFPDAPRRGTTWYALMRAMQIRRLRLPPPAVKPGERPAAARTEPDRLGFAGRTRRSPAGVWSRPWSIATWVDRA